MNSLRIISAHSLRKQRGSYCSSPCRPPSILGRAPETFESDHGIEGTPVDPGSHEDGLLRGYGADRSLSQDGGPGQGEGIAIHCSVQYHLASGHSDRSFETFSVSVPLVYPYPLSTRSVTIARFCVRLLSCTAVSVLCQSQTTQDNTKPSPAVHCLL
jgi:hypothetical protein